MICAMPTRGASRTVCGKPDAQWAKYGTSFAWRYVTCPDCLKNDKIDLGDLDIRSTYTILTVKVERKG